MESAGGHSTGRVRRVWLLALGLLVLSSAAAAQDLRIGYVDMKRLFDAAPQIVDVREAIAREFDPRNQSILDDEARLQRMEADLAEATDISSEERFEREREIRNLQRSIERRREDLAEELRFRTNVEKKELEETIEVAVEQIARSGSFDLILTSPVAYASDRIDVTDRVLQWLEEDFQSQRSGEDRAGQ